MPAQRQFGMDHPHYDWSPITTRGVLRWPDNARVALCVIVNLEHMEWSTPEGSFQSRSLAGGSVARPFPDYARLSHREYGHRVGVFRVLDVLEKHGIKATVALDAMTAANYPFLVRHLLERHRPASLSYRPAASDQVSGRHSKPHHVPRRGVADHRRRHSRLLHRKLLRRCRYPRGEIEFLSNQLSAVTAQQKRGVA